MKELRPAATYYVRRWLGDDGDGSAAVQFDVALLEEQLERMERPARTRRPILAWLLGVVGLVAIVGLGIHGYTAFATIDRINVNSKIATPNPVVLFQDVATNGPRVGSTVESSSRATYARSLEQFLLDGTGLSMGIVLMLAAFFVRANQ